MIVRAKRTSNFTIMSNSGLNDKRLSLKAKGMLAHLLGKPDDWQVSDRQLATICPDGRAAVQAALKELEECGYLKRSRVRRDDGTFTWVSVVYDEPWFDFPATDKPATENRAKLSTEGISTERTKQQQPAAVVDGERKEQKERAAVHKCWQQNMPGMITSIIGEEINDLVKEHGATAMIHAITVAVNANVRTMRYVKGVLNKMQNGTPAGSYSNGKPVTVQRMEGEDW